MRGANASVMFSCARCPQSFISLAGLLNHTCAGRVAPEPEPPVWLDNPLPPELRVVRQPRPRKSRARRPAPIGEIELAPTETAPDGGGNAQSAGVRPNTPFARGTERIRPGDAWKRRTPARAVTYCPCGVALPMQLPERCGECGRPTGADRATTGQGNGQ